MLSLAKNDKKCTQIEFNMNYERILPKENPSKFSKILDEVNDTNMELEACVFWLYQSVIILDRTTNRLVSIHLKTMKVEVVKDFLDKNSLVEKIALSEQD